MRRAIPALVALVALLGCRAADTEAAAAKSKPELLVLSSLPLLFDEGFGIEPAKGATAILLREHYRLKPIDLPSQLPSGGVLLGAQPRALPAEELVALDAWVRAGGKLLLLADPMLEWPSKRPLGDRLRPPVSFADTGLLLHWGLRLDAPDTRGPMRLARVEFVSPGRLVKIGGSCRVELEGIVAECALGAGRVRVVSDADWLNVEAGESRGSLAMLGDSTESLGQPK